MKAIMITVLTAIEVYMMTVTVAIAQITIMTKVHLVMMMILLVGKLLMYCCAMMVILIVLTLLIDTLAYITGSNRKWGE